MINQEIINEIKKLDNNERLAIIEAILGMIRNDLQPYEQEKINKNKLALEIAAKTLLTDYISDDELTAFKALDGEDFHA